MTMTCCSAHIIVGWITVIACNIPTKFPTINRRLLHKAAWIQFWQSSQMEFIIGMWDPFSDPFSWFTYFCSFDWVRLNMEWDCEWTTFCWFSSSSNFKHKKKGFFRHIIFTDIKHRFSEWITWIKMELRSNIHSSIESKFVNICWNMWLY